MTIRKAEEKDIPALSELATRTFYQAYSWYNSPENMKEYVLHYFSFDNLHKELTNIETPYYLAEENNVLIGYFKLGNQNNCTLLTSSHSEIERIYVDESIQRKGIGFKMLETILKLCRERGNTFIWLGVWQKNEKAISFYQKNGFEIIGKTQFTLGDDVQDDYVMSLKITFTN